MAWSTQERSLFYAFILLMYKMEETIYIFANSILDTIIQDGHKREKNNNNVVKSKI